MESIARWKGGLQFEGTFSTGHSVAMDASVAQGGADGGPRPVELLLMALAGCTGMDVLAILRKKRQKISSLQVQVMGERAEKHPKVFTKLRVIYDVAGEEIVYNAVEQAVHLSEEKYCSISAMIRQVVSISSEIRIREGAQPSNG